MTWSKYSSSKYFILAISCGKVFGIDLFNIVNDFIQITWFDMKCRSKNNRCYFFARCCMYKFLLQMFCLFTRMLKVVFLAHENVEIWAPLNDILSFILKLKNFMYKVFECVIKRCTFKGFTEFIKIGNVDKNKWNCSMRYTLLGKTVFEFIDKIKTVQNCWAIFRFAFRIVLDESNNFFIALLETIWWHTDRLLFVTKLFLSRYCLVHLHSLLMLRTALHHGWFCLKSIQVIGFIKHFCFGISVSKCFSLKNKKWKKMFYFFLKLNFLECIEFVIEFIGIFRENRKEDFLHFSEEVHRWCQSEVQTLVKVYFQHHQRKDT